MAGAAPGRGSCSQVSCSASGGHPESAQIFTATVPNRPMEGDDVILTAPNAPDRILNASWHSGFQPSDPDTITSCIPTAQAGPCTQRLGPAHTRREALTSWNTLGIRNLTPSDTGFYSLVLNTDSGLEKASPYIHVWRPREFLLIPDISANMNVAVENVD
uniref:Carcinoembryonic antigen-related cell adhesion molecule 3-like n=1 Tax=Phascolarctos cinereus TaxID=38626 RepID=A0A6P5LSG8_PHACI|nr:carcinoembryonic antigen-related cell adhesion molecule 3-like [Phascolarctos cinereus]